MQSTHVSKLLRSALLAGGAVLCLVQPSVAQNWEGDHQLRAGFFFQGGGASFNASNGALADSGSTSTSGFGLTAGAEMLRAGGWTFGVEGDFGQTFGTSKTLVNVGLAEDYFASIRGRAGYYVRPDVVVYGTGGIGFRGITVTDSSGNRGERTLYGGVYGGGFEWHHGLAILFAEYLHEQYGHESQLVSTTNYRVGADDDQFRLGVKFKLGFDNYTDDVRDNPRR